MIRTSSFICVYNNLFRRKVGPYQVVERRGRMYLDVGLVELTQGLYPVMPHQRRVHVVHVALFEIGKVRFFSPSA